MALAVALPLLLAPKVTAAGRPDRRTRPAGPRLPHPCAGRRLGAFVVARLARPWQGHQRYQCVGFYPQMGWFVANWLELYGEGTAHVHYRPTRPLGGVVGISGRHYFLRERHWTPYAFWAAAWSGRHSRRRSWTECGTSS